MTLRVVHLSEREAEDLFHESGLRESIFEGWHVVDDAAEWGFKYKGPHDTEADAHKVLLSLTTKAAGIDPAGAESDAHLVVGDPGGDA
jgi:hypothetical protein